jgi:hypothetical protein
MILVRRKVMPNRLSFLYFLLKLPNAKIKVGSSATKYKRNKGYQPEYNENKQIITYII